MPSEVIAIETYGSTAEKNRLFISNEVGVLVKKDGYTDSSLRSSFKKFATSVFLPQGYPDSVSNDYLEYQLWDTLQAFCSSITGTLATQAVLKGYGVGDEKATVAAATITWMLKDGAGMVGRILFAWFKGTQLDCDAKRWRFHADILNDLAILMDLIAPIFKSYFIYIACLSSITRSIVGVAGGATRAALTLHQAKRDNMADVSAKDGSQETLVNLMALIAGFILTPLVADKSFLVWILFFIFTFLHLFANYRAVSSVIMETVNKPRMFILLEGYVKENVVSEPSHVSLLDPVLRSPGYYSKVNMGVPLKTALENVHTNDLKEIISKRPQYIIGLSDQKWSINVAIHHDASNYEKRKSCFHALLLDMVVHETIQIEKLAGNFNKKTSGTLSPSQLMHETQILVDEIYPKFEKELKHKGWDLHRCHLGFDEWRFEWDKKVL